MRTKAPPTLQREPYVKWWKWYALARGEMAFRYGRRWIPKDTYKEQYYMGETVTSAVRNIETNLLARGR